MWARRLEQAGIHVVYGIPGLKVHSKLALVIRREKGQLRRYAHIGTGNYNPMTARIYSDLGLLTANGPITADVAELFNMLTGFADPKGYRRLLVAPTHMKDQLIALIRYEAEEARAGRVGQVIVKCNALAERDMVKELYAASQAGVQIELLVRGICCLIPGVEGHSENIRVRSVVGRFLEHSRVYWFRHGDRPKAFLGSADWMGRNLNRRIEVLTPVIDPRLASWLREVLLARYLRDTRRTRQMGPDGIYRRIETGEEDIDVHGLFLEDAAS